MEAQLAGGQRKINEADAIVVGDSTGVGSEGRLGAIEQRKVL
jgi:hypothetical protein